MNTIRNSELDLMIDQLKIKVLIIDIRRNRDKKY